MGLLDEYEEMWAGLWFLTELGVEDAAEEHADDGVYGLREGAGEGLPPVLRYGEDDATPDVSIDKDDELYCKYL